MDIPKLMKYFDYMPDVYCWIGGGGLRSVYDNLKSKDIDFFVSCRRDFDISVDHLLSNGFLLIREMDILFRFKTKEGMEVDLFCKEERCTPERSVLLSDYTMCACAIDRYGSMFYHPNFLKDVNSKSLVYLGNDIMPSQAKSRCNRLNRFLKIGYNISKEELIKLTDRMCQDKVRFYKDYWEPTIQEFDVHVRYNNYYHNV